MIEPLQITVQSSIFDRQRTLTLDPEFISFDDKDLMDAPPTQLSASEIVGFKYGIKWIQGYQFYIGRIYCVDIKDSANQTIKLRLKTIYGIRKKALAHKYSQIVTALYQYYFNDISKKYLQEFADGKEVEILGVHFTSQGIVLNKKAGFISWEDVGTRNYQSYYLLFSKKEPTRYQTFEYLDNWNAGILYSVSRYILKEKGLWHE